MGKLRSQLREDHAEAAVSIWKEALFGVEALLLHTAPVFYGFGVPHGDSSGVVLIPCFLGTDPQMTHLYHWLRRTGTGRTSRALALMQGVRISWRANV